MLSGSRVNWKNFHPSGSKIVLSLAVLAVLTGSISVPVLSGFRIRRVLPVM